VVRDPSPLPTVVPLHSNFFFPTQRVFNNNGNLLPVAYVVLLILPLPSLYLLAPLHQSPSPCIQTFTQALALTPLAITKTPLPFPEYYMYSPPLGSPKGVQLSIPPCTIFLPSQICPLPFLSDVLRVSPPTSIPTGYFRLLNVFFFF